MIDLADIFPVDCVNTEVEFACGGSMILHTDHQLSDEELQECRRLTVKEFKAVLMATGRFNEVPFGNC